MSNGASRLFNVMKRTSEDTNTSPSQVVSLTVKSIQPLVFIRDDRLEIPEEFCLFSRLVKKENIKIGDIVTAMVFNEGQSYFIEDNNDDNLIIVSEAELDKKLESKINYTDKITYHNWHSLLLTRSDENFIYLTLYGSAHLKEGNYSIANPFKLETFGEIYATLTVPLSAINDILRRDWGFEIFLDRTKLSYDIHGTIGGGINYNGIASVRDADLILQSN